MIDHSAESYELQLKACHNINPNPGTYINWCCSVARSHIWPPRRPIGERKALHHAAAQVRSSALSRRKSKRLRWWLKNCLVCRLLAGGSARAGSGGGGSQGSQIGPHAARNVWKRRLIFTFFVTKGIMELYLSKFRNSYTPPAARIRVKD
jgi:hypothetical protein